MVELLLQRLTPIGQATPGELYVNGLFECGTLEDLVRVSKIHGRTAIPAGRYRVALENSPRFGPDTLTLKNVPNFTYIRIHAGNTVAETEGCVLVGKVQHDQIAGGTSGPALTRLKAKIQAAILARGEEVWITVRNPLKGN